MIVCSSEALTDEWVTEGKSASWSPDGTWPYWATQIYTLVLKCAGISRPPYFIPRPGNS